MIRAVTLVQTTDRNVNQLQQGIKAAVDPLLANPTNLGNRVTEVQLQVGQTAINHGLGRDLQGWWITRLRGAANIYDNQDANPSPSTTLLLVSDVAVVVDVYCF